MFERVWNELGPIDILVNNAGIETIVPFLELTDDQWTRLVDVNLRGAWLCSQVFCRRVVAAQRKASIVNIGSIQAAKVLPGRTHYAPTKLGLEALTRNMSAEMTPQGIRVNCIHPGLIDTPMTSWVMKDPDILPIVLAQISMGRAGQPREIGSGCGVLRLGRGQLPDRAVDVRRRRVGGQVGREKAEGREGKGVAPAQLMPTRMTRCPPGPCRCWAAAPVWSGPRAAEPRFVECQRSPSEPENRRGDSSRRVRSL